MRGPVAKTAGRGPIVAALLVIGFCVGRAVAGELPSEKPQGALAIDVHEVEQRWQELTLPQRLTVVAHLIRIGEHERALRLLDGIGEAPPAARRVIQLLRARIEKAAGHVELAAGIERDIIIEDPTFTSARLALAADLVALKRDESARVHYEILLGAVSDTEQKRAIRQLMADIDERRGWSLSAISGVSATSNPKYRAEPSQIDVRGGIGPFIGIVGGWNRPISDRLSVFVSGSATGTTWLDDTPSDIGLTGEAGLRRKFDWGALAISATLADRWLADGRLLKSTGVKLTSAVRISLQDVLSIWSECALNAIEPADPHEGHSCDANASFDHQFAPESFVRFIWGAERQKTADPSLGYTAPIVGIGFGYEFAQYDVSLYAQASLAHRMFDGLEAGAETHRVDDRADFSLQWSTRRWEYLGLTPSLRYTFTLNHSNLSEHTYDSHNVTFTLTQRF